MGMSASQARLIALTARMSDVEYEGQQINQQRLTLANKISDIYAQMENLTVPTPPSPLDYQITTYTGNVDATGKSVDVAVQDNGKLTIGVYREAGVDKFDTNKPIKAIDVVSSPETMTADPTPYKSSNIGHTRGDGIEVSLPDLASVSSADQVSKDLFESNSTLATYFKPVMTDQLDENNQVVKDDNGNNVKVESGKYEYKPGYSGTIYFGTRSTSTSYRLSKIGSEWSAIYGAGTYDTSLGSPKYSFKTSDEDLSNLSYQQAYDLKDGYSKAEQDNFKGYYKDDQCTQEFNPTFDPVTGKPTSSIPENLYKKKQGSTVNGNQLYSISEATNKYDITEINKIKERIKATMADQHEYDQDKVFANWFIYQDGNGLHAVQVDNGKATEYEKQDNAAGYVTVQNVNIADKTPDALGNLKVDVDVPVSNAPGAATEKVEIKLKKGKASGADTDDYKAAMAQYEADKIKYDHEQKELNNQTSVWQQEDKKLDLKLKRLDTERNALNTEIDAVKKVIQDSTDKGFKTFSG